MSVVRRMIGRSVEELVEMGKTGSSLAEDHLFFHQWNKRSLTQLSLRTATVAYFYLATFSTRSNLAVQTQVRSFF